MGALASDAVGASTHPRDTYFERMHAKHGKTRLQPSVLFRLLLLAALNLDALLCKLSSKGKKLQEAAEKIKKLLGYFKKIQKLYMS
jgi:hypothetical protein